MASTAGGALPKELPLLKDVGAARREALFVQKLQLCTVVYRFDTEMSGVPGSGVGAEGMSGSTTSAAAAETRGKEAKRQTLMELLDFVNTQVRMRTRANCVCMPPWRDPLKQKASCLHETCKLQLLWTMYH